MDGYFVWTRRVSLTTWTVFLFFFLVAVVHGQQFVSSSEWVGCEAEQGKLQMSVRATVEKGWPGAIYTYSFGNPQGAQDVRILLAVEKDGEDILVAEFITDEKKILADKVVRGVAIISVKAGRARTFSVKDGSTETLKKPVKVRLLNNDDTVLCEGVIHLVFPSWLVK